jgi:AcrR family transcriptional regulator
VPNSKSHSFIEPQQERSRKRFEEVLKTAEFIYKNQDDYDLTVQDIAKLSGMKRPSIYKFFPSNESILEALSYKYSSSLFSLVKKNLNNLNYSDEKEIIKAVVDVYAIYVNNNYCISDLVFNVFSKNFLIEEILKLIEAKSTGETKKIKFSLSILMACLGDSLRQEKVITPSCVAETKKACLLYLAS